MAGIDKLTAAQLSSATYSGNPVPTGWTVYGTASTSTNSATVFVKNSTRQAVVTFRGSDNLTNFKSDLIYSGASQWQNIKPLAEKLLNNLKDNPAYSGYEIMTEGHSLGGGMSQTMALGQGLSGYSQNALPISQGAINDDIVANGGTYAGAVAAWQAAGHTFTQTNVSGDPATMFYSSLQGQTYLPGPVTILASPYAALEATGLLLTATPLAPEGAAMVGESALKAHSINTVIGLLSAQNPASTGDTPTVDAQLKANASGIENAFSSTTFTTNSSGVVVATASNGAQVDVVATNTTVNSDLYSIVQNGTTTQFYEAVTGAGGATISQSNATVSLLDNSTAAAAGSGLTINLGKSVTLSDTSSGSTAINLNGGSDGVTVAGTGLTLNGVNAGSVANLGANSVATMNGNGGTTNVQGAGVSLKVVGSAETVNVLNSGSTITIGGNGQNNAAQTNWVTFSTGQSGIVNETDNSNLNIHGTGVVANIGNKDNIGLGGAADTTNVNGAGSQVWTGGNGQNNVAQTNWVVFGEGQSGIVNSIDNTNLNIHGDGVIANVGNNVDVGLGGAADTTNVSGLNTRVWTGNNGQNADTAHDDIVNFGNSQAGHVMENDNSRIDIDGNGVVAEAGSNDKIGLGGSANTIDVNGTGTQTWIGGNGVNADNAHDDFVNFINGQGGTVNENDNSRLDIHGNGVTAAAGSNDDIGLVGAANSANVAGTGTQAWIGGNGQNAADADADYLSFTSGQAGSVYVVDNSRLGILQGNGLMTYIGANVNLGLGGSKETVTATGTNNGLWFGSNTAGDKIFGSNSHVYAGTNDLIDLHGNGDVGTEGAGSKMLAYGNGNVVNGSPVGNAQEAIDNSIGQLSVSPVNSIDAGLFGDPATGSPSAPPACTGGHYEDQLVGYEPEYDEDGELVGEEPDYESEWVSDPVLLNLSGGKVDTQGVAKSQASFDMQNTGTKCRTGWATAGEGLLVYDPAGKGNVNSDSDLVAGMAVLAGMDNNHDGKLDGSDSAWKDLALWVDRDGSGNFQSGDLHTLDDMGIASISLSGKHVNRDSHGNTILDESTFTWANGTLGDIAGVDLVSRPPVRLDASDRSSGATLSQLENVGASWNQLDMIGASYNQLISAMATFAPQSATASGTDWMRRADGGASLLTMPR